MRRFSLLACFILACGSAADAPDSSTTDASTDGQASDASDAGNVDLDAKADAPNEIPAISGLVLWLDAAKGINADAGAVSAWADQSPAKNDAAIVSAKFPPTLTTLPNGFPAVHYHAGGNQVLAIKDATTLQWGAGDYAIATVARFDNDPSGPLPVGAFYMKIGGAGGFAFLGNAQVIEDGGALKNTTGLQVYENNLSRVETLTPYNDSTLRLYLCRRTAGVVEIRVNGMSVDTESSGVDISNVGSDVGIGTSVQGGAPLDGDIAELIAVKGTLDAQDLESLEAYWMSKYGL